MIDVKALRRPLRISREELAFRSGVNRYKLYQFEFGFNTPDQQEEASIRQALLEIARERSIVLHSQLQT